MPRGWKLLWAPTTLETAEEAQWYRFNRIDSEIVLAYGNRKSLLLQEADDALMKSLTEEERAWLKEAVDAVIAEQSEKKRAKAMQNDIAFMEAFERELETEREKQMGGGKNGDADEETGADEASSAEV